MEVSRGRDLLWANLALRLKVDVPREVYPRSIVRSGFH